VPDRVHRRWCVRDAPRLGSILSAVVAGCEGYIYGPQDVNFDCYLLAPLNYYASGAESFDGAFEVSWRYAAATACNSGYVPSRSADSALANIGIAAPASSP
jgi:hypothetical protein